MTVSDVDLPSVRPRVWADAFPWIPGKAASDVWEIGTWWNAPIDHTAAATRDAILDNIASLAIDRLGKWSIGEVFPGLPGDAVLANLGLPVRAANVLHREQLTLSDDLVDLPIERLLSFRHAGVGTVTAILRQLAELSTSLPQATILITDTGDHSVESSSLSLGTLLQDVEALAEWNHTIGRAGHSVFAELALGAPEAVIAARKRLLGLTAAEVLPTSSSTVADLLDRSIYAMDERLQAILAERLFAWYPKTLEELGQEFGITRERIRQLEVKARSRLNEMVSSDSPAGRVAGLVRAEIVGVRPLEKLLTEIPALRQTLKSVRQPVWRVIDVLDDAYEIVDGWCAEPSIEAARRETAVFLDELADEYGVVRRADVSLAGPDEAGTLPWLKDWLEYLGYAMQGPFVLLKTRSVNDVAAAVLSIEGAPLKIQELHALIGRGSENSLRNQLYSDPTFHRVDLEHWALTSWGMAGYANIRTEIGKLLEQAGGELPLTSVAQSLVQRFGVSANSVTIYAGNAPYEVWNGIVRNMSNQLAGGGKNPAKVRSYYLRGEDWLYRTSVTHDHLRGSGWPASTALGTILGMAPGGYAELPSRLGSQNFSYKSHQPSYGSIKRFLQDMDVGIGDEIFCVFKSDGTFDVEELGAVPEDKMAQALRLIGADVRLGVEEAIKALGAAIKFASDADIVSIAEGYKARHEQQLHDLLLGVGPSTVDP